MNTTDLSPEQVKAMLIQCVNKLEAIEAELQRFTSFEAQLENAANQLATIRSKYGQAG